MAVVVSPPPPKTDAKFDDWMYLFWKRLLNAIGIPAGGTTNQVLTKTSNTDYAVTWASVPTPSTVIATPANNIVHNSYFQVRDKTDHADVVFATAAPYKLHAYRWWGAAGASGFKTLIDSANDMDRIIIKRYSGSSTLPVRLVQVLDTEESLRWREKDKTLRVSFALHSGANVTSVTFKSSSGMNVDQTVDDYIAGTWSGYWNEISVTASGSHDFYIDYVYQLAFEIEVVFGSTASATDDEVEIYYFIIDDPNTIASPFDSKPRAVAQEECSRYYQKLDLYLTTTEISVPISMRDVPTVTLGDAAAFTTTGTTADVLVIKVNGAGDNGMHTVYLDCEL